MPCMPCSVPVPGDARQHSTFRKQVNRKKREEEAAKKEEEERAKKAAEGGPPQEGPGQEGASQPDAAAPADPSSEAVPTSEAGCVLMLICSNLDTCRCS